MELNNDKEKLDQELVERLKDQIPELFRGRGLYQNLQQIFQLLPGNNLDAAFHIADELCREIEDAVKDVKNLDQNESISPPEGSVYSGGQYPVKQSLKAKSLFACVVGLTFCSLVASVYLANNAEPSGAATDLVAVLSTTWQTGFGTILGLLGGRFIR